MTSQPSASAPATLPDLKQQHERAQKQFRTVRIAVLVVVGLFALFVAGACMAASPGVTGLLIGLLALLVFVAFFGVLMAASASKERRQPGPASNGPSSFGQVVTSAPGPQVWEAVNSALRAQKFVAPGRPIDPQTVVSSRSLSMSSWGETITVRIEGSHDGRGLVTAWSRPAYPLQWLDYGRNRSFANTVLEVVPGATPLA